MSAIGFARKSNRTTASLQKRTQISEAERTRLETVFNNIHDSVMILRSRKCHHACEPGHVPSFWNQRSRLQLASLYLMLLRIQMLLNLITRVDSNDPFQYHEVSFPDGRVGNAQFAADSWSGTCSDHAGYYLSQGSGSDRTEFVHTVSHDLRSPLTSVIGYAELVESGRSTK